MIALASGDALCALEFESAWGLESACGSSEAPEGSPAMPGRRVRASGGGAPRAVKNATRLKRLDARLSRWFPPHEVDDSTCPMIERTRSYLADYFNGAAADTAALS